MRQILVTTFLLFSTFAKESPSIDREQAVKAFKYLNQIRTAPMRFAKEFAFSSEVRAMPALAWNDTLASVAEQKALDMATRGYLAHVDPEGYGINYYIDKAGYKLDSTWLRKPKANFFESCNGGGLTGQEAIKMLLIDDGVPTLGHRKHLLGIDSWSATLKDIGIGYARAGDNKQYRTYTCVIIAKHSR